MFTLISSRELYLVTLADQKLLGNFNPFYFTLILVVFKWKKKSLNNLYVYERLVVIVEW